MDPVLARIAAVVTVVLVATIAGRIVQSRDGRIVRAAASGAADTLARLGHAVPATGPRAVLFGSPTCAPCDTVKVMLDELEAEVPDFEWRYVDAADHLELAADLSVRRVPTLLVFDAAGELTARSSGVPSPSELRAAIPAAA